MLGCGSLRTAHKLGSPRLALSRAFCRLAERRALRRNLWWTLPALEMLLSFSKDSPWAGRDNLGFAARGT